MALDTATIIKGTVGVLGVSGLGVGGYYGIQALNKVTIESKLNKEEFEKLEKTSSEWENIFKSYQTVSESNQILKFSGEKINNKEELQKRCEEILNKDSSEDNTTNNYVKQAKKWCIVPTTVEKSLRGKRILRTDDAKEDTEDKTEWDEKIKNYTKQGNNNKITGLDYSGTPIETPEKNNRNLIRGACKKLIEKKSYEGDYEDAINKARDWCSI